jgi:hypothetical protein
MTLPRSILALTALVVALSAGLLSASAASAAGPTAIAADSDGVVYSGFASGGTIQRNAGADGAPLASWGTAGSNPGQLGGIVAIDVAPGGSGNVWILDTNRRVQEFTRSGTYIRGFQLDACDAGVSPDPLQRGGLDVTNDMVYVVHPCRDRVYRFDKSDLVEKAWAQVNGPLKGASAQLYGTAPSESQFLYVARPTRNDIVWFDLDSLSWHGPKAVGGAPTDVFVDAYGVLFVSERTGDTIKLYGSDGNLFRTLGGTGSALGKLNDANAFDVFEQFSDLAGNLFIADTGNNRIQRWNPFGYTFWGATANGGGAPVAAPTNSALPSISGTPSQGNSVTCQNGSWTNSPTSYSYRWQRNGTNISSATSQSYTIQAADVGQSLTCVVTATNSAGSASATSAPVTPAAGGGVPANTSQPQISGTAVVGQTLSCAPGTWTNDPDFYTYRWRRNGTIVATGQNYTLVSADAGTAITCEVIATNGSGTGTATSDPVTPTATGGGGGDVGVTINSGAIATNSPGVTLTIREPAGATSVRISNDGGFAGAETRAVRGDDTYTWTLATSGGERLPKTGYVRFVGAGDANQTFTDDIVLDQRPPLTMSATLTRSTLRVKARDTGTGVEKVEYARNKLAKNSVTRKFKRKIKVAKPGKARFARTIDGAGNRSDWKRVKRK